MYLSVVVVLVVVVLYLIVVMDAEWIDPTASTSASSSEWRDPSVLVPPSVPVSASPSVPVPPSVLVPPSVPELLEGYSRELEDFPELVVDDELVFNPIDAADNCWEGDEWVGDIPAAGTCSKEEAEVYMSDYLLEKYNSGKWYATDVCKLAYCAMSGGMGGGRGRTGEAAWLTNFALQPPPEKGVRFWKRF